MKTLLTLFGLLFTLCSFGQDVDLAAAKVEKVKGVYIFVGSEPTNSYDFVASFPAKIDWEGNRRKSYEEVIDKANKKYSTFNGMIFRDTDFKKVELIRFTDSQVTRGGIAIRSKVSFTKGRQVYYGEVVELGTAKQGKEKEKGMVRYLNVFEEEKVEKLKYLDMTAMSEAEYEAKKTDFLNNVVAKYKFSLNEKVTWQKGENMLFGEIVSLDNINHKGSIKHFDQFGDEMISTIDYLDLEKMSQSDFDKYFEQQQVEIAKYKFVVGEKVSFVKNSIGKPKAQITGEVVELNDSTHKASIKYADDTGVEVVESVPYLDITKIVN